MTSTKAITNFVETLARAKPTENAINPWSYDRKGNAVRRKNLTTYLTAIAQLDPRVIIVGEAPGYRGTRRTGVPFCSEKLLLSNPFFTSRKEFTIEAGTIPIAESSASIVWGAFDTLDFYPLIWASFPFHPHQPGNTESNRTPTREEIEFGQPFLKSIIELFNITDVVAVGRAGEAALAKLGISATPIRHPSHGGANLFRSGLAKFVKGK